MLDDSSPFHVAYAQLTQSNYGFQLLVMVDSIDFVTTSKRHIVFCDGCRMVLFLNENKGAWMRTTSLRYIKKVRI